MYVLYITYRAMNSVVFCGYESFKNRIKAIWTKFEIFSKTNFGDTAVKFFSCDSLYGFTDSYKYIWNACDPYVVTSSEGKTWFCFYEKSKKIINNEK